MEWEEIERSAPKSIQFQRYTKTDIDCPKCGEKVYIDNGIVLTTYPERYSYLCPCGWSNP